METGFNEITFTYQQKKQQDMNVHLQKTSQGDFKSNSILKCICWKLWCHSTSYLSSQIIRQESQELNVVELKMVSSQNFKPDDIMSGLFFDRGFNVLLSGCVLY